MHTIYSTDEFRLESVRVGLVDAIMAQAKANEGARRKRTLRREDAELAITLAHGLVVGNYAPNVLRVYSRDGFVAKSYSYPAFISYIEFRLEHDGKCALSAGVASAAQGQAHGLVTFNGRHMSDVTRAELLAAAAAAA